MKRIRDYDHRLAAIHRHYNSSFHPMHMAEFPPVNATDPDESDQHVDINATWKTHKIGMIVVVFLALAIAMLVGVYVGHWILR
jgi:hypothetical protein